MLNILNFFLLMHNDFTKQSTFFLKTMHFTQYDNAGQQEPIIPVLNYYYFIFIINALFFYC